MRATTLLAGAALAMVVAAPRAARCAGIAARPGAHSLVLTIATASARGTAAITKIHELRTLLGVRASAEAGVVETILEVPQFAVAIARQSSPLQLSVAPTYEKIGRGRSPGLALSGRF